MAVKKYTFEGFSQFRAPLCYELKGRTLEFVMDNGHTYTASFITGNEVRWQETGEKEHTDRYECLKVDDQVYFVNIEIADSQPRTNLALGIDFEEMLVTCVVASHEEQGPKAYLTETKIIFGALRKADGTLETRRHGYTDDLAGKAIRWSYGPDFSIIHAYLDENRCSPILVCHEEFKNREVVDAIINNTPISWPKERSDKTDWIKLKEGIYMLNFCEKCYPEILSYPHDNCLTFVFDLKRLHNFGRYFGYSEAKKRECYVFSAFGKYMNMEPITK